MSDDSQLKSSSWWKYIKLFFFHHYISRYNVLEMSRLVELVDPSADNEEVRDQENQKTQGKTNQEYRKKKSYRKHGT